MTDREAYDRMAQGDNAGFFWMFMECEAEFIQWLAATYQCPSVEGEKIFEEAAIKVYEKIKGGQYVYNSKLKTYLFAVGKFMWFEASRKQHKILAIASDDNEGTYDVELEEKLTRMENAIQRLGEKCRELLDMRILQELDYSHILTVLGYKNIDVVKTAKHKCLEQLRKSMHT